MKPKRSLLSHFLLQLSWSFTLVNSDWTLDVMTLTESSNSQEFLFKLEKSELSDLKSHIRIDQPDRPVSIFSLLEEHTNQHTQYMYPYVLLLSQSQEENNSAQFNDKKMNSTTDYEMIRSLILTGSIPSVAIEYGLHSSGNRMFASKDKVMQAVVLDSSPRSDAHRAILSEPIWAVPLLINNQNFAFNIRLHSNGMAPLPDHTLKQLFLAGFGEGTKPAFFSVIGKTADDWNSSLPVSNVSFSVSGIPSQTSVFSISPVIDDSHFILGLPGSKTVALFQASEKLNGVDICNCGSDPSPVQVISLPDRILISYKTGVWEMVGNFSVPDKQNASWFWEKRVGNSWRILDKCVKQFATSPSPLEPRGRKILAVGGCGNEGEVYVADYFARQASPVMFKPMASQGISVCDVAEKLTDCHILSACVRPVGFGDFFFLLGDIGMLNTSYELLYINPSNGENKTVNAEISPPRSSLVNGTFTKRLSDFRLYGITSTESNALLLWGDALLISRDDGQSWEFLSDFSGNDIKMVSNIENGFFYAVTKNQEIWAGARHSKSVLKIFPTYSFNFITGCLFQPNNSHIAALLTDVKLNLQVVYFDKRDSWKVKTCQGKSQLDEILAHVMFTERWERQMENSLHSGGQGVSSTVPNDCPYEFIQMSVVMRWKGSITQKTIYEYAPPTETSKWPRSSQDHLLLYSMTIKNLERNNRFRGAHIGTHRNPVEVWKEAVRIHTRYDQYLEWVDPTGHPYDLNAEEYGQIYESEKERTEFRISPQGIFLDFDQVAILNVHVQMGDSALDMDKMQMIADSGLRTNLEIEIDKTVNYLQNSVDFEIKIQDQRKVVDQVPPGGSLGLTPVDLKILPTSFECKSNSPTETNQQTFWSLSLSTGCPPTNALIFDYKTTQRFLSAIGETYFDCLQPTPDVPCFYFGTPIFPFFAYLDDADGYWKNYTGNYTLTVVGAGVKGLDDMTIFTREEVISFNSMFAHPSKNVWGPVDGVAIVTEEGLPIYDIYNHGMSFFCQPKSPCANIIPSFVSAPEVYVLVEFSNKGVDHSTHCDFTTRFPMRVHGLPINTIHMSLILTMWGLGVQCTFILIYILLHCRVDPWNKSLWTRTQERFPFLKIKRRVEPLVDWRAIVERRMRVNTSASSETEPDAISESGHFITMRRKQLRDTSIIKVVYED